MSLRIGNGCGFWGDNLDAPIFLAEQGRLDYLTLEYLAELTMSILAIQKQRDPQAGFAGDFLDVLERLVPILKAQPGLKIITNAGGINPAACASKAAAALTVAPLVHEFAWPWDDWTRLSAGTVAGHLIECGAQATGGLWCNYQDAADMANVGYPVVEVSSDGRFVITKPENSGGSVN